MSPMTKDGDHSKERYFLVAESSLCGLMSRCQHCSKRTSIVLQQVVGSMVVVSAKCPEGHIMCWESQPRHKTMPWGNLRCAAAILFSGGSATRTVTLCAHLNMPMFQLRTFNKLQKCYLAPAIVDTWNTEQRDIPASIAGRDLIGVGDGRCDSPGFSAKYGSYTVMDLQKQRVIDVQLVQVIQQCSVFSRVALIFKFSHMSIMLARMKLA